MLSFIKNSTKNNLSGEIYIYADRDGLAELIDALNYLKEGNDSHIHLFEGNELSTFNLKDISDGFSNVVHVEIINTENLEKR